MAYLSRFGGVPRSSIFLTEQAAAQADVAAYGQFWVKNTTPNRAYFTDDAGTDLDLSARLANIVEDLSPELGGNLAGQTYNIDNIGSLGVGGANDASHKAHIQRSGSKNILLLERTDSSYADIHFMDSGTTGSAYVGVGCLGDTLRFYANNTYAGHFTTDGLHTYSSVWVGGSNYINEGAAADPDSAGWGQFWVKSDTPCTPWFTDDAGNDRALVWVESGTFTPVIWDLTLSSGESQTYNSQAGVYRKIGDVVFFWITLDMLSAGTLNTAEAARVGGLPYAANGTVDGNCQGTWGSSLALGADYGISGSIVSGTSYIKLFKWSATAGPTDLTISQLSIPSVLVLSGSYLTA